VVVVVAVLASAHPATAATASHVGTPLTWTTVNADRCGIAVADVAGDAVIATPT
jgi:hypothetical protein